MVRVRVNRTYIHPPFVTSRPYPLKPKVQPDKFVHISRELTESPYRGNMVHARCLDLKRRFKRLFLLDRCEAVLSPVEAVKAMVSDLHKTEDLK